MKSTDLHPLLEAEFESVMIILNSRATTKTVDAFVLSWVKLEKQLRKIFCFLIYQQSTIDRTNYEQLVNVLVKNPKLSPRTFIAAIDLICTTTVRQMIGDDYEKLRVHLSRIRDQRNKIAHGMVTGKGISSKSLELDISILIDWITKLAQGAKLAIGYDGLVRNTFRSSKTSNIIAVSNWPFDSIATFEVWLTSLSNDG